jgi:hypothetical protein
VDDEGLERSLEELWQALSGLERTDEMTRKRVEWFRSLEKREQEAAVQE